MVEKRVMDGKTWVNLEDVNGLIKAKHREIVQWMKRLHAAGVSNTEWTATPPTLTELKREINMSENGEKYIIFALNKDGEWEYFMELVKFDEIPEFVRRRMKNHDGGYAAVGTDDIDEAALYDCWEDAQDALAAIDAECPTQACKWRITKRWMFDTSESREAIKKLFSENEEKPDEKAEAIAQAESAIERTRAALNRAEKALADVKGGDVEKPSEAPQEPKTRTVMNRKAAGLCPARYTVWYRNDEDTTQHCMGFVRFEKGIPVFTNRPCKAMWFIWRGMAEKVAEKCGEGFEVVDMIGQMTAEERLLRAIFREDGMDGDEEPEYHGDGTRAEDEDWDGEDA